jgi:hypothetical protein
LSGVSNTSYGSVTITPAQDGYVRFTVGQDFVDTTQMEVGSAPTNYEKYSFVIDKLKVTLPEKSVTEKEINDGAITPNKTNFFVIGKNKFNIATITSGGFYQLNGTFTANILYFYSDLISVVEGKTYIFSGDSGTIGVRALLIMSFVSCYKDGIIVPVSDAVGRNVSQITIPTGVNQIRISSIVEYLTRNIQVELGSIITDFEDYRKIIDNRYLPDKATQIEKVSYTILAPKKLYTVYDDIHTSSSDAKQRKTALPVYIDYMIPEQTDILAKNGWDKFILEDYNDGGRNNLNTSVPATVIDRKFEFKSDKYNVNPIIIQQVATKMTAPTDKSFVLTIGDSVTEAGRSNYLYYMSATEYFEKEAIDRGTTNNVKFIGARTIKKFTLDYLGSTLNLKACAEGRSGWTLHNYMRHTNNLVTNQTTWDNMGLGNSSHTDYIGSDAQNELIRKTCMVDSKETVENFFFNNAKTGTNRFSINKWLERYRTLDDNGNRLILGNGTGTQITASNLTEMDVCTPTHIVIAMGHNDMENNYKGTPDEFHTNIQEIITAIRAELPNVIILLVATPPLIGTWHEELYQNYLFTNGVIRPYNTQKYMDNVRWMVSYCDANESNGIYLLPQYFVTPTCNAMSTVKQTDGIGNVYYQPYAAGGLNAHPNENANRIWGYQLYSQLKYLMTL